MQPQKANVVYRSPQLEIVGPWTLIEELAFTQTQAKGLPPHEQETILNRVMQNYYVLCSVTDQQIPLSELKYWNVERQIAYASAQNVPLSHFYPHLVDETP